MNPLQVPQQGPLWRELPVSRAFFNISLNFLIKVLLIKEILPFPQRPWERKCPHVPENGALTEADTYSRALLSISFGVPSKGSLPPGSPHRAPTERDALFPEPTSIHISRSLVNEPPSRFLSGTPVERDACLKTFFCITFRVTSEGVPLPGSPHRAPTERDDLFSEPSIPLSRSLVHESPSRFLYRTPMERDACLQRLLLHNHQDPQ